MSLVTYVRQSGNRKLGPMPMSMTEKDTCPDTCPFMKNGCYAETGWTGVHWRAMKNALDWRAFCKAISKLPKNSAWRHNVAGDLPGRSRTIDWRKLYRLVLANRKRRGFTYTHKYISTGDPASDRDRPNNAVIRRSNANGFTINLSANSPSHADELLKLDIGPVVCTLPSDSTEKRTPAGTPIVICPQTFTDVSCLQCMYCWKRDRKAVVGFPAHGKRAKNANEVIRNWSEEISK